MDLACRRRSDRPDFTTDPGKPILLNAEGSISFVNRGKEIEGVVASATDS